MFGLPHGFECCVGTCFKKIASRAACEEEKCVRDVPSRLNIPPTSCNTAELLGSTCATSIDAHLM